MKKFLSVFAMALVALATMAGEWTAAEGTATGEFAPVYGYNFETNQHNQMQYPATELAGMDAGTEITAVKFYSSTPDAVNALGSTVTVSLANINDVTPWELNAWQEVTGNLLDVDVTAVATVTPAADEDGVWTITFDAPFTYTGGALLVDVQTVAGNYNDTYFYGKEMGANYVMTVYGYSGNTKKGESILPMATFTYEGGGEDPGLATLAEANALEDDAEFTFGGDAVVTVFKNGYLFLRDESGYGMIAGVEGTFENSQVLSEGWNATKTSVNNGWVRYINAAGLSASGETNAELAAPIVLSTLPDESMLNAYVVIENTSVSNASGGMPGLPTRVYTLPDGKTIQKTTTLWGMNEDASGGAFNVYGVICKVSNKLMINPVAFEPYEEPEPEWLLGDVNHDHYVNVTDVTALIKYILTSGEEPEEFYVEQANVDGEGQINVADVTTLIQMILNNK